MKTEVSSNQISGFIITHRAINAQINLQVYATEGFDICLTAEPENIILFSLMFTLNLKRILRYLL